MCHTHTQHQVGCKIYLKIYPEHGEIEGNEDYEQNYIHVQNIKRIIFLKTGEVVGF